MCIIVARDEEARTRNMHGGKVGGAGNGDYGRERSRAGEKMELFQVTPRLAVLHPFTPPQYHVSISCQPQESGRPDKRAGGWKIQQNPDQNHAKTSPEGDTDVSAGCLTFKPLPFSQDEPAFSPEEIEKLPAALKLEPKDVELVLDTSTFIMQQVQHHIHTTLLTPCSQHNEHLKSTLQTSLGHFVLPHSNTFE